MDKDNFIQKILEIEKKPGGKQAIRFLVSAFGGAIPFLGGAISAASSYWAETEQNKFNENMIESLSSTNNDLSKIQKVLESQLREPTKMNLALLIGEVLNVELPSIYPEKGVLMVDTILNGETRAEFKPYESKGWITINQNGNMTNMGSGNRIGNSIEDMKRPWGFGNGYTIIFNKSLYE